VLTRTDCSSAEVCGFLTMVSCVRVGAVREGGRAGRAREVHGAAHAHRHDADHGGWLLPPGNGTLYPCNSAVLTTWRRLT